MNIPSTLAANTARFFGATSPTKSKQRAKNPRSAHPLPVLTTEGPSGALIDNHLDCPPGNFVVTLIGQLSRRAI